MKKNYFAPVAKMINLSIEDAILAGSQGGVTDGSKVGNEYDENDVTYSNKREIWNND